MNGVEPGGDRPRPVLEYLVDGDAVVDGEGEVEIGPAVAGAVCESADDGRCDHARVRLGQPEHVVAGAVAVLDAEHAPIVADRPWSAGRRLTSSCNRRRRGSVHVTVTTADITGEPIENAAVVGEEMERWLRDTDGFEGFLLLATEGKAIGLAFWASREVAERHNHARSQFRERMLSIAERADRGGRRLRRRIRAFRTGAARGRRLVASVRMGLHILAERNEEACSRPR